MERMIPETIDFNSLSKKQLVELVINKYNDCFKLEKENEKLKEENEYLHKLLPEADGYIIEKQLEKRLWNDGEEDVYEDWGEGKLIRNTR